MPLTMAGTGLERTVKRITGRGEIRRFLASLGFVEGGSVTIITELGGNLIVNVKNTRVAISHAMASRILV